MNALQTSLLIAAGCGMMLPGCMHTPAVLPRPASWAPAVEVDGLPNLHRVSPVLYRSAKPAPGGYAAARKLGVRTVVNLRRDDEVASRRDPSGLEVIPIPVNTQAPSYDEARRFFEVVDDPARTPVLLHCYHGADRTGAFTALYRINRQGWSTEDAITEMTGGGYNFHRMWMSLVPWVRDAPAFPGPAKGGR